MKDQLCQYACPSCKRAILNRKIDRCLYCGATLPEDLLFSKQQIEKMEEQTRASEEQQKRNKSPKVGSDVGLGSDWIDAVDLANDLGSLFD